MSAHEAGHATPDADERTRADALLARLWDDLAAIRSLHERGVVHLRRESEEQIRDLRQQLNEARDERAAATTAGADVEELRARLNEVEEELEEVYDTETWKVGRALVYLPRRAKLALKKWWRQRRETPPR